MSRTRIHFIHTNDLHSHFERWPQTVTQIKRLKQSFEDKNESYLLVDLGDHMDRSHVITEGSLGEANIDLMNQLKYDYVTIGNNEGITFAKDQIERLYQKAHFSILVSNLKYQDNSEPPWLKPSTIHTINGKKIGLIGATINFDPFYQLLGWKIEDPFETIKKQVNILRDQVDLLVVLSHMGLHNDELLAQQVKEIDIILGAHTHHLIEKGLQVGSCMINQAGRSGENIGQVTIEWEDEHRVIIAQCIPTEKNELDESTRTQLHSWHERALDSLNESVTYLDQELEAAWHVESSCTNLLAEGLKNWCKTSISMVNSGQILEHLHSGQITKGDLLRVCPHPINPCIVKLSGKEIWDILQRSLDMELQQKILKGFGFRGKIMGMLSIDGLEVEYTHLSPAERVITHIEVKDQGKPIELEAEYDVATIDMFTFNPIIPEIHRAKQVKFFLPEFLRDVLANRLKQGQIQTAFEKRWKCIEDNGGESNEIY